MGLLAPTRKWWLKKWSIRFAKKWQITVITNRLPIACSWICQRCLSCSMTIKGFKSVSFAIRCTYWSKLHRWYRMRQSRKTQRFPRAWRNFTSKLCKGKCLSLLGRASSTLICRSRRDYRSTSGPRRNSCARGSTSPRVVSTSQPSLKVQIGSTSSEWLGTGLVALSASLTRSLRALSLLIKEGVAVHTISKPWFGLFFACTWKTCDNPKKRYYLFGILHL